MAAVQGADSSPFEQVAAAVRLIEAAEDVHQGRFTRARSADHRHEVALLDLQADIVKCFDLRTPQMKGLADIF